MPSSLFHLIRGLLFKPSPIAEGVQREIHTPAPRPPRPIDPLAHMGPTVEDEGFDYGRPFETLGLRSIEDFPTVEDFAVDEDKGITTASGQFVGDAKERRKAVGDSVTGQGTESVKGDWSAYQVPDALQAWYNSQGFIGYQACALIGQHWLVDKVCTMPGEDAVRNGYEVSITNDSNPGLSGVESENDEIVAKLKELDTSYAIKSQLVQFWRFTQIYGIRICVFDVDSDDPDYYAKPFNIDGVREGSYRGIKQVDPYWTMPVMAGRETVDPTSLEFYDPSYWVIGGKKYHKSHLVIGRGPQPADILKPTYVFGGIPLVQRIYERVYAAERTANEGPLLAMTKRTSVLHTDIAKAEAQPDKFRARLMKWVNWRDNFGIKTVGINEVVEQFDTSLADLDSVIMTQYQLVAAIGEVPATKLLGTSPKGFNATGEFEEKSYHERLETVQMHLTPLLDRHHLLLTKSEFGQTFAVQAVWNRVDSFSASELATLNEQKASTGEKLITLGVISPDEERQRLKNDPLSGYNHLGDDDANEEMGASPENEAKLVTAQAKETTAQNPSPSPGAPGSTPPGGKPAPSNPNDSTGVQPEMQKLKALLDQNAGNADPQIAPMLQQLNALLDGPGASNLDASDIQPLLQSLSMMFGAPTTADGQRTAPSANNSTQGSTKPGTHRNYRTGDGNGTNLDEPGNKQYSARKMPRMRMGRLTLVIENPRNSIRAGTTLAGEDWRTQMTHHYGYINGVEGADGDELDCFVGPDVASRDVYVVNQMEPTTGEFDEHKVMLGFNSEDEAKKAYLENYQANWTGFMSIVPMDWTSFADWMKTGDLTAACETH